MRPLLLGEGLVGLIGIRESRVYPGSAPLDGGNSLLLLDCY